MSGVPSDRRGNLCRSIPRMSRSPNDLDNILRFHAVNFNSIVGKKGYNMRVVQTCKTSQRISFKLKTITPNWQIDLGWLGHCKVPLTGSPSAEMKTPRVLVPVHDRIKNSFRPMTVIEGLTTKEAGSYDCERGRIGNRDACSRSTKL